MRDPDAEVSGQGGAVLSHTHEIQAVSTGGGGDIINTDNTSHIPVTQQPIVVMEPPMSDTDGQKSETGSPGPGSGAGHEESDTHHDSLSSGHRDDGGHLHSSATQTICD